MSELTGKALTYIKNVQENDAAGVDTLLPLTIYAKLRDAGLVKKVEGVTNPRGKVKVSITPAGRAYTVPA